MLSNTSLGSSTSAESSKRGLDFSGPDKLPVKESALYAPWMEKFSSMGRTTTFKFPFLLPHQMGAASSKKKTLFTN